MKFNFSSVKKLIKDNFMIIFCVFAIVLKQSVMQGSVSHSLTGDTFNGVYFNNPFALAHVATVLLLCVPIFLFKNRWKEYYAVAINAIFSIICLVDLWFYRATNHPLELKYFLYPELNNTLGISLYQPRRMDFLFVIDIVLLIALLIIGVNKNKKAKSSIKLAVISSLVLIVAIFTGIHLIGSDSDFDVLEASPGSSIRGKGVIGHKIWEVRRTLKDYNYDINEEEIDEVTQWLNNNKENLPDNEYKGIFKGKNLIFLQIESLEQFVINQKVYGQEITPNLNKLLGNSLYFSNIYEQNNAGSSIDCDLMVNTSVLPLGGDITTLTYPQKDYLGLPETLKDDGYTAALTHVEGSSAWYWAEAGIKYGYDKLWGINDYVLDEVVGYGLSDESFYRQFKEKLKELPEPFFTLSPTLSSHGPFSYAEEYKYLDLPEEVDENTMGGYLQGIHYADKQLGKFIEELDSMGYLDNSIVVIYGDHAGVNKYYKSHLEGLNMEGDWWKINESKVPLIMYSKDVIGKEFDVKGGLVDLYPTICYLLDVKNTEYQNYVMGRNLVNTNRTATVIPSGIVGTPSSEEEKEHLESAYDISRKYILNEYYKNKK